MIQINEKIIYFNPWRRNLLEYLPGCICNYCNNFPHSDDTEITFPEIMIAFNRLCQELYGTASTCVLVLNASIKKIQECLRFLSLTGNTARTYNDNKDRNRHTERSTWTFLIINIAEHCKLFQGAYDKVVQAFTIANLWF